VSPNDLSDLDGLTVPTLANAVELFGVEAPNQGFTREPLTCHFPSFGNCVGHAVTVHARTDQKAQGFDEHEYWRWLEAHPGPKVVVVEDLDREPGGAMWGEWNANVHLALGCVGTITQGAVRDLDALERLHFHAFATAVSVAHGYGVFVEYDEPATVAGLTVHTGELLVADLHGVLRIPHEVPLDELADVARTIDRLESEIFAYCQSRDFGVDGLARLQDDVLARWPKPR
jgi:regulator of RNase E activity RraA